MKRKILLIAGIFYGLILTQATAQIRFGLNAGANFSTVSTFAVDKHSLESGIGYRIGGFSEIPFGKLGLHVEAAYSFVTMTAFFDDNITLHYVSLPLNLYYRPIQRLKILAGPEFNFLVSHEGTAYQTSYGMEDAFKTFEYGVHAEIEFMTTKRLGISARNYFGLQSNGTQDPASPHGIFGPYKLNIFGLGINYYFKDKK